MMKKKLYLIAALAVIFCMAALMSLSAFADDTLVLPEGEPVGSGYCVTSVNDGVPTYSNVAWAVYNSETAEKFDIYFYIDAESTNAASTAIDTKTLTGTALAGSTLKDTPWGAWYSNIDRVYIGEGITAVNSLYAMSMSLVEVSSDLTSVNNAAFQNCRSLENFHVRGRTYSENTMDISTLGWIGTQAFENCDKADNYILPKINISYGKEFAGNKSLKSVTLPGSYNYSGRPFHNCAALEEIIIKGQPTMTITFMDCTAVKTVKLLDPEYMPANSGWLNADVIPNVTFICTSEEQAEFIKSTYSTDKVEILDTSSPLTYDGFKVRTEGYNGIRNIFVFDEVVNSVKESEGYTLVEYGAIVASKETNDRFGGIELSYDAESGTYVTADAKIIKMPIYDDGTYVGKLLSYDDVSTSFALSIINFDEDNYTAEICVSGYVIYEYEGTEIVSYSFYSNPAYQSIDLYGATLGMYTGGVLNSADDVDGILWNTLKAGVAEFTPGNGYTYVEGMTDMKGVQDFSTSFKALEIPVVTWTTSGDVTTFTQSGDVTATLLIDPTDNSYVALYRSESGTGVIPASDDTVRPQFANYGKYPNYAGATPMPKLDVGVNNNIKTIILDNGIIEIAGSGFTRMENCKKYIYSSTLATIGGSAFYCNRVVSTMACTGNGVVENVIDLGSVAKMDTNYAFNGVNNSAATKIILPVKCTSGQDWRDNVGHGFGQSFGSTLKCIVVPDSCALFTSQALTFSNFTDLKIIQKTYNSDMAASIVARGGMVYYQNETTPW